MADNKGSNRGWLVAGLVAVVLGLGAAALAIGASRDDSAQDGSGGEDAAELSSELVEDGSASDGDAGTDGDAEGSAESGDGAVEGGDGAVEGGDGAEPDSGTAHVDCPSETPADLCELGRFVEDVRGRPFKAFPVIELEENAEFDRRLLELFDEESGELETSGHVLRSMGLIPADSDLVALVRTTLEIGVVGYYDSDTKGLVVRGSEFNLYSKLVLVHELTHAHDDQWIGLDRPEFEETGDEAEFGFLAVTEGNATRVDHLWRAALSAEDQEELSAQELGVLSPEDIQIYLSLPPYLLQMQISPYVDGLALVQQIAAEGGEAAVDAAFDDPPRTSEQVLSPDQYLSGEAVDLPDLPNADGEVVDDGIIGELGFRHWLGLRAGEGWGGDRYVTWLEGGQACTRIEVTADSSRDLDEIESAANSWADEASDRTVEVVADSVRITGCG